MNKFLCRFFTVILLLSNLATICVANDLTEDRETSDILFDLEGKNLQGDYVLVEKETFCHIFSDKKKSIMLTVTILGENILIRETIFNDTTCSLLISQVTESYSDFKIISSTELSITELSQKVFTSDRVSSQSESGEHFFWTIIKINKDELIISNMSGELFQFIKTDRN